METLPGTVSLLAVLIDFMDIFFLAVDCLPSPRHL